MKSNHRALYGISVDLSVSPDAKTIMYWIIFNAVTSHRVGECNVRSKTAEFMKTIAALMNYGRA